MQWVLWGYFNTGADVYDCVVVLINSCAAIVQFCGIFTECCWLLFVAVVIHLYHLQCKIQTCIVSHSITVSLEYATWLPVTLNSPSVGLMTVIIIATLPLVCNIIQANVYFLKYVMLLGGLVAELQGHWLCCHFIDHDICYVHYNCIPILYCLQVTTTCL